MKNLVNLTFLFVARLSLCLMSASALFCLLNRDLSVNYFNGSAAVLGELTNLTYLFVVVSVLPDDCYYHFMSANMNRNIEDNDFEGDCPDMSRMEYLMHVFVIALLQHIK